MNFQIVDEVKSTKSAIISSYPTSMSEIIVILITKRRIRIPGILFYTDSGFGVSSSCTLFFIRTSKFWLSLIVLTFLGNFNIKCS